MWGMLTGMSSRGGPISEQSLAFGAIASSINSPVYLSVPVKDRAIVDEFLARLDEWLAAEIRRFGAAHDNLVLFHVTPDIYHLRLSDGTVLRKAWGRDWAPSSGDSSGPAWGTGCISRASRRFSKTCSRCKLIASSRRRSHRPSWPMA